MEQKYLGNANKTVFESLIFFFVFPYFSLKHLILNVDLILFCFMFLL